MRKLTVFMHVSLDGFVAGPNGEMDWITINEEMFDFVGRRTDIADLALYGRKTFEMMEDYWPKAGEQPNATAHDIKHSKWYNQVEKIVLSKTIASDPAKKVRVISQNLKSEISTLKQKGNSEILIFGSPGAVHSLTAENLVDDYWLFLNPTLLGEGIPLFKNVRKRVKLKLASSRPFPAGVVCLNYSAS